MTNRTAINYQALREIAKQATQGEWVAFISPGTGTYAVHTPGDKRCEDVIKWPGFDGQKNAENNARYIAAFNPEVVQALLDENERMCRDLMARNGEIDGLRKRVEELEALAKASPVASCIVENGEMCVDGFGEYVGHSLPDGTHELYAAPPVPEAEPVAWTDEEELRDVKQYGFGEIFQCPPDKYADPRRVIPLYRVPPVSVLPEDVRRTLAAVAKLNNEMYRWTSCMSYNASYVGEPEGLLKRNIREIERIMDAHRAWEKELYSEQN
ncbi:ead/Ea22-like family protein [Escherichia coli]|nr:ead/Ea22-like family protein [Escherichia coli]MCV1488942.1 ead/Ea22-like family protein [Escherichia coli]